MTLASAAVLNDVGYPVDTARLQMAAFTVLQQQGAAPESTLTIVVSSDDEVARLNREFRGIDAPTDVLSFPADEPPGNLGNEPPYLGDLVIAYPYASAQAGREGHDLMQSLMLLVVHGTLHLLGYDHDTAARRAGMWAAQDRVLNALSIPLSIVPALESYDHADS